MTYRFTTEEYLKLSRVSEAATIALGRLGGLHGHELMGATMLSFSERGMHTLSTYLGEEVWEDRDRLFKTLSDLAVRHGYGHAALAPVSEAWFDSKFAGADGHEGWYHIYFI